jgi:hypothetical protein
VPGIIPNQPNFATLKFDNFRVRCYFIDLFNLILLNATVLPMLHCSTSSGEITMTMNDFCGPDANRKIEKLEVCSERGSGIAKGTILIPIFEISLEELRLRMCLQHVIPLCRQGNGEVVSDTISGMTAGGLGNERAYTVTILGCSCDVILGEHLPQQSYNIVNTQPKKQSGWQKLMEWLSK